MVDPLAQELPPSGALGETTTKHGTPRRTYQRTSSTAASATTTSPAASCTPDYTDGARPGATTDYPLPLTSPAYATTRT